MEHVEVSWLQNVSSFKEALKLTLGCSGQLIKKYYSSKEQSRVIKPRDVSRLPLGLVNHMQINPHYTGPEIFILDETENFLVVHKPPGVHCHPHTYDDKDTLLNFLTQRNKWESLLVNQTSYDRGLLYRLDFETSGVVILAKNEKSYRAIRENFDTIVKRKFYWAIVDGDFDKEGRWTHHFKATGNKGVKQKVLDHSEEGTFEGTFSVVKIASGNNKSLVLVNLRTGLRHQIRAQLSHLGFPIVGDDLYGGRNAERLFLHAFRYEFGETFEDTKPELFDVFFDLHSTLQMSHDVLGRF